MFPRLLATHCPPRRAFQRLLILCALSLGIVTSACGGGSAESGEATSGGEETSAVALDPGAPQGSQVTLTFTAATTSEPDAEIPRNAVGVQLADETGATVDVALVELTGTCGAVEPGAGGFASFQCWWAGGGTKLHARSENGELVIYREELDEGMAEDPSQAVTIHRFSLAAGATVTAAAPAP